MPSGRVLIVDDQTGITAVVEEYFTSLGYEVDVAHDGAVAVMRATALRPDVVLLDVNMPEVSGAEVLDRLRAIDPTVPIVMRQQALPARYPRAHSPPPSPPAAAEAGRILN